MKTFAKTVALLFASAVVLWLVDLRRRKAARIERETTEQGQRWEEEAPQPTTLQRGAATNQG